MGKLAEEAARLIESLSPQKAEALLEYARYLAEKADEEEWDRKFSDPKYSRKFKEMGEQALREYREGKSTPLDPKKL